MKATIISPNAIDPFAYIRIQIILTIAADVNGHLVGELVVSPTSLLWQCLKILPDVVANLYNIDKVITDIAANV